MTQKANLPKVVTVFGGSGFVGRHVVRALVKRGHRVRVAVRRPDLAIHLQPIGDVGQITAIQANLRHRWSVDRAVEGADAVINLVGILFESGKQTFSAVQEFGAKAVAEACRDAGVPLVHMSAIGANVDGEAEYAKTKGRAEKAVLDTLGDRAIVMRPSIIFGPEDDFFNKFADMARFSPALPLIGGGTTKFQPVYVGDVAEAFARAVDGEVAGGRIYELGGPEVLTFRECLEEVLKITRRKRFFVNIPWWAAMMQGRILGMLPKPLLTTDQVTLLKRDNVVSAEADVDGRTLDAIGIKPASVDAILPTYLWRYREAGQFTNPAAPSENGGTG
ncbi:complex I NDUFA9 subunit family protein [Oricola cellulosilytica]|uniref:Complex I NDUFA9 subunit family protein n=1 Tax=Oricola cellulosilytica TaxID=1429082 RepID=A0A4R0PKU5_9HYPH|nr:complex I NDUFA9 subunit family protein [Oricola cellulosilytica]TCD16159.1 complex I NDUFA9 subunit family protein [Oricola cellulosilytica]